MNTRRNFLKQLSAFGALSSVCGLGVAMSYKFSEENNFLRPPSAVAKDKFLSLCIKCGQCLQVCPYDSIFLSKLGHDIGTPYIDAFKRACYLCELLPCVLACPSGALDHHIENVKQVNMGKAKVVKLNACLALTNKPYSEDDLKIMFYHAKSLDENEMHTQSLKKTQNSKKQQQIKVLKKLQTLVNKPCSVCKDLCPSSINAIKFTSLNDGLKPEILSHCVGCGVCVEVCPTQVLSIVPKDI